MNDGLDEKLLERVYILSKNSDCSKIRFGALALTKDGRVVGEGWNHNPNPFLNYSCSEFCVGGIRKGVRSGTCVERCYAIHAEQHALITAVQKPYEILVAGWFPDGSLFDNGGGFYCTVCSRFMLVSGVQIVSVWSKGFRKMLTIEECWNDSYKIACA
jgi:deoxycytidylate deaminase